MEGLSPEKAKGFWCPFAMVGNGASSYNRLEDGTIAEGSFCIADKCMMWKVIEVVQNEPYRLGQCMLRNNVVLPKK